MPKRKKKVVKKSVNRKINSSNSKVLSKNKAPKWYFISSFTISLILLFIYFVDYLSTNQIISNFLGILVLVWFLINIFMIFSFISNKSGSKAIAISSLYIIYFALLFVDGFIYGLTNGAVEILSNSLSNSLELFFIILILGVSLSAIRKGEYK